MSTTKTKTLFFEEIAKTDKVFNRDTIANYPTGHANASGGYREVKYRKGTYGQTEGNIFGDILPDTPACPYHMPRNINRFLDPRLNIRRKDAGAIIEAKDINDLIDKIKLYSYVWEAEANNIYSFPGVTGRSNNPINISNLKYIEAGSGLRKRNQPTHTILDGSFDPKIITIEKLPIFICVKGNSIQDTRDKLLAAVASNTKSGISFGNPNPFGFVSTDENKVPGYYNSDTISTTKVINAGHWPLAGAKFIQSETNKDEFHIEFLSGPLRGEFAKDQDGNILNFKSGVPYIQSYLMNNEIDLPTKYNGFILYWFNPIIDLLPTTPEVITTTTTESPIYGIKSYKQIQVPSYSGLRKKVLNSIPDIPTDGATPEINYNFVNAAINIKYSEEIGDPANLHEIENAFCNHIYEMYLRFGYVDIRDTELKIAMKRFRDALALLPTKVLHLPRQKIEETTCSKELSPGNWVNQSYIYSIQSVEPVLKYSMSLDSNWGDHGGDPDPVLCFNIIALRWDPTTKMLTTSKPFSTSTILDRVGYKGIIEKHEYNDAFFLDPLGYLESNPNIFKNPEESFLLEEGFYFVVDKFLSYEYILGYDEMGIPLLDRMYFDESGIGYRDKYSLSLGYEITKQDRRLYMRGLICSDVSPINPDGTCTITHTHTTSIRDIMIDETTTTVTLKESDITYSKENYFIGNAPYPIIKGSDFKNVRNVINAYINSILVLAQTGLNNGVADADTNMEIGAWNVSQAAGSSVFNKDDPDSTFLGYHAESTGIIKLDFYNVLVDAYKLMINSCICNANCACNIVCACNINCGCNY